MKKIIYKEGGKVSLHENFYKRMIQELAKIKLKKMSVNQSLVLKLLIEEDNLFTMPNDPNQQVTGTESADNGAFVDKTPEAAQKSTNKALSEGKIEEKDASLYFYLRWKGTAYYAAGCEQFVKLLADTRDGQELLKLAKEIEGALDETLYIGAKADEALSACISIIAFGYLDPTPDKFFFKTLASLISESNETWAEFFAKFGLEYFIEAAATGGLGAIPGVGPALRKATKEIVSETGEKAAKQLPGEVIEKQKQLGDRLARQAIPDAKDLEKLESLLKERFNKLMNSAGGGWDRFSRLIRRNPRSAEVIGLLEPDEFKNIVDFVTKEAAKSTASRPGGDLGNLFYLQVRSTIEAKQKKLQGTLDDLIEKYGDEITDAQKEQLKKLKEQVAIADDYVKYVNNDSFRKNWINACRDSFDDFVKVARDNQQLLQTSIKKGQIQLIEKGTESLTTAGSRAMSRFMSAGSVQKMEAALGGAKGRIERFKIAFNYIIGKELPPNLLKAVDKGFRKGLIDEIVDPDLKDVLKKFSDYAEQKVLHQSGKSAPKLQSTKEAYKKARTALLSKPDYSGGELDKAIKAMSGHGNKEFLSGKHINDEIDKVIDNYIVELQKQGFVKEDSYLALLEKELSTIDMLTGAGKSVELRKRNILKDVLAMTFGYSGMGKDGWSGSFGKKELMFTGLSYLFGTKTVPRTLSKEISQQLGLDEYENNPFSGGGGIDTQYGNAFPLSGNPEITRNRRRNLLQTMIMLDPENAAKYIKAAAAKGDIVKYIGKSGKKEKFGLFNLPGQTGKINIPSTTDYGLSLNDIIDPGNFSNENHVKVVDKEFKAFISQQEAFLEKRVPGYKKGTDFINFVNNPAIYNTETRKLEPIPDMTWDKKLDAMPFFAFMKAADVVVTGNTTNRSGIQVLGAVLDAAGNAMNSLIRTLNPFDSVGVFDRGWWPFPSKTERIMENIMNGSDEFADKLKSVHFGRLFQNDAALKNPAFPFDRSEINGLIEYTAEYTEKLVNLGANSGFLNEENEINLTEINRYSAEVSAFKNDIPVVSKRFSSTGKQGSAYQTREVKEQLFLNMIRDRLTDFDLRFNRRDMMQKYADAGNAINGHVYSDQLQTESFRLGDKVILSEGELRSIIAKTIKKKRILKEVSNFNISAAQKEHAEELALYTEYQMEKNQYLFAGTATNINLNDWERLSKIYSNKDKIDPSQALTTQQNDLSLLYTVANESTNPSINISNSFFVRVIFLTMGGSISNSSNNVDFDSFALKHIGGNRFEFLNFNLTSEIKDEFLTLTVPKGVGAKGIRGTESLDTKFYGNVTDTSLTNKTKENWNSRLKDARAAFESLVLDSIAEINPAKMLGPVFPLVIIGYSNQLQGSIANADVQKNIAEKNNYLVKKDDLFPLTKPIFDRAGNNKIDTSLVNSSESYLVLNLSKSPQVIKAVASVNKEIASTKQYEKLYFKDDANGEKQINKTTLDDKLIKKKAKRQKEKNKKKPKEEKILTTAEMRKEYLVHANIVDETGKFVSKKANAIGVGDGPYMSNFAAQYYFVVCTEKLIGSNELRRSEALTWKLYKFGWDKKWQKKIFKGKVEDDAVGLIDGNSDINTLQNHGFILGIRKIFEIAKNNKIGPFDSNQSQNIASININNIKATNANFIEELQGEIKKLQPEFKGYYNYPMSGIASLLRDITYDFKPDDKYSFAKKSFINENKKLKLDQKILEEVLRMYSE